MPSPTIPDSESTPEKQGLSNVTCCGAARSHCRPLRSIAVPSTHEIGCSTYLNQCRSAQRMFSQAPEAWKPKTPSTPYSMLSLQTAAHSSPPLSPWMARQILRNYPPYMLSTRDGSIMLMLLEWLIAAALSPAFIKDPFETYVETAWNQPSLHVH